MKVLDTVWFTTHDRRIVGIVLGEDEVTKEHKAYLGVGDGDDEGLDTKIILEQGCRIHVHSAQRVVDHLKAVIS